MSASLIFLIIRLYRRVAPAAGIFLPLPTSCRFVPTCSQYLEQAVRDHGALRGAWLGLRRLLRCHPGRSVALDLPPVPVRRIPHSEV